MLKGKRPMFWLRITRRLVAVRVGQLVHWCNVQSYLDHNQHTLGLRPTIVDHIGETADPSQPPGNPPLPLPDNFDYKNWPEVEVRFQQTHNWFKGVAAWMDKHDKEVHAVSGVELAEFPLTYESVPDGLQDLLQWLNDRDTGAWNWLSKHRADSGEDPSDPPPPPPPFGGD